MSETRTWRPHPSRTCWHEAGHAILAAHFRRTVGRVCVSPLAEDSRRCEWGPAVEGTDEATAIRQRIQIQAAGRLAESFYRADADKKICDTFDLLSHDEEMRVHIPSTAELEIVEEECHPNYEPIPTDGELTLAHLDRLAELEPGLDLEAELTRLEDEVPNILHDHQDVLQDVAQLLRDEIVIQPGVVNGIFNHYYPEA